MLGAMESRREQLLDAAVDYCVRHGLGNLSLRPLADDIGTSARLLVFHFKSKDELIGAVLSELDKRLQASFEKVVGKNEQHAKAPLRLFWDWASAKENMPSMRLLYELQIAAAQNPKRYGRYLKKMSLDWQAAVIGALSDAAAKEPIATLCIAVFDGLFLELVGAGDRARLGKALDCFIAMVRAAVEAEGSRR